MSVKADKKEQSGGSNAVFKLVFAIVTVGAVSALWLADAQAAPAYALGNNVVYRAEIGMAISGVLYVTFVTLRLAWHWETFTKFGAGVATAEAPAAENVEAAASDLEKLSTELKALSEEAAANFVALDARVTELENRTGQEGGR